MTRKQEKQEIEGFLRWPLLWQLLPTLTLMHSQFILKFSYLHLELTLRLSVNVRLQVIIISRYVFNYLCKCLLDSLIGFVVVFGFLDFF